MRTIAVVTGTRAEYGYLKPLMDAINKDQDLQLIPLITGMHLLPSFGKTCDIVKKDFPNSFTIPMELPGDSLYDMGHYLASGIKNFSSYFHTNTPDILIVLGDRSESLAAAFAAMYQNVPIAHINGGDVSGGTIDESIRHALTKIAHIHFTHTKENAKRVQQLGEEEKRIFVTGALSLDVIYNQQLLSKKKVFSKYHLDPHQTTYLMVQHPITTLPDRGISQFKTVLSVMDSLQHQTVLLYPNCDAGGQSFISMIEDFKRPYLHKFKSIPHVDYLSLLKAVDILIGNSSSGIIEAAAFQKPVVNVGGRQQGRVRSDNVLSVEPKKKEILNAVNMITQDALFQKKCKQCVNIFGDGHASEKIIEILKTIDISPDFIKKQITY